MATTVRRRPREVCAICLTPTTKRNAGDHIVIERGPHRGKCLAQLAREIVARDPGPWRRGVSAPANYSSMPAWVRAIDDDPLQNVVREAIDTRSWALDRGALTRPTTARLMRSGDRLLDAIRLGEVKGAPARRKAEAALRHFDRAGSSVSP